MIDVLIATQSTTAGSTPLWLGDAVAAAGVSLTIVLLLVTVGRRIATKSDVNDAQTKNEQLIRDVKEDLARIIQEGSVFGREARASVC